MPSGAIQRRRKRQRARRFDQDRRSTADALRRPPPHKRSPGLQGVPPLPAAGPRQSFRLDQERTPDPPQTGYGMAEARNHQPIEKAGANRPKRRAGGSAVAPSRSHTRTGNETKPAAKKSYGACASTRNAPASNAARLRRQPESKIILPASRVIPVPQGSAPTDLSKPALRSNPPERKGQACCSRTLRRRSPFGSWTMRTRLTRRGSSVKHMKLEPRDGLHHLATRRHPAKRVEDHAADRIDIFAMSSRGLNSSPILAATSSISALASTTNTPRRSA